MADNASASGGLGNAAMPTRKHGRPSDLHTECRGCQLGLSIDDDSHMCYTVAGPAFNRTRTGVDTDILRLVGSSTPFSFVDVPTPPTSFATNVTQLDSDSEDISMAEPEDQPRKIVKIKRINPRSETRGNTTISTLEEGTSEVRKCKVHVPEQSGQVHCI